MAITIQNEPSNNVSLADEILFVAYESVKANDPVTYPDYRYVLDIYVDDVFVARQIARPDPTYKMGKFNISTVLRDYATYGLKANYASDTETYTSKVNYKLHFGEEYDLTFYPDLLVDTDSRSAYKSYAKRPFSTSEVMQAKDNAFLTNMPDNVYGFKTDKWFLASYFSNVSGVTGFTFQFSDGAVNIGSTGTYLLPGYQGDTIAQGNFGFIKAADKLGLSISQRDQITQLQIDCDTGQIITVHYQCSKYTPVTLAWLNPYGAYDSYSFGMVNKKSAEIARKDFQRLPYQLNASGEVSYSENGVFYGSRRGYASNIKHTLKLTSHLLRDDEYQWLSEMFASPDVYMYDPTTNLFFPVTVQETNYEYRTYKNSKFTPLEFNVMFSDDYNAQFL